MWFRLASDSMFLPRSAGRENLTPLVEIHKVKFSSDSTGRADAEEE